MKYKFTIISLLIFSTVFLLRLDFSCPTQWDLIQIGMSREKVYKLLGRGKDENLDWTGHHWSSKGMIFNDEIEILFTNDEVSHIIQRKTFITGQTMKIVRLEKLKN